MSAAVTSPGHGLPQIQPSGKDLIGRECGAAEQSVDLERKVDVRIMACSTSTEEAGLCAALEHLAARKDSASLEKLKTAYKMPWLYLGMVVELNDGMRAVVVGADDSYKRRLVLHSIDESGQSTIYQVPPGFRIRHLIGDYVVAVDGKRLDRLQRWAKVQR